MTFAPGALPATAESDITAIIKKDGIASLSLKQLRNRLEDKYQVDLTAHKDVISALVSKVVSSPEMSKTVAAAKSKAEKAQKAAKPDKKSAKPEKVAKAVKPADYPKGPQTAYFLFMGEVRSKVAAENPTLSTADLTKKLAEMYRALPADEVERIQALAKKDKERHETEMAAFLANGGEKVGRATKASKEGKAAKPAKDPNMPKRPLSAFFIFSNEKRPEVSKEMNNDIGKIGKRMGELWAVISADEKARFEALAAKDKLRFAKECEERGYPVTGTKTARSE